MHLTAFRSQSRHEDSLIISIISNPSGFVHYCPPPDPSWDGSYRVACRDSTLTLSCCEHLRRTFMSARRTCNAHRGSAQKRQSPLGSSRLRCAPGVAVVPLCMMGLSTSVWPLGGSVVCKTGSAVVAFEYAFTGVKLDIWACVCGFCFVSVHVCVLCGKGK